MDEFKQVIQILYVTFSNPIQSQLELGLQAN